MKRLILFLIGFFSLNAFADTPIYPATISPSSLLNTSRQIVIVQTNSWNTMYGELQRYQRSDETHSWRPEGAPISVVVGKNGMGWGAGYQNGNLADPVKKEGDNRSPAGIFPIGSAFGFSSIPLTGTQLAYIPLTATTICVDDQQSKYYGQIVDSAKIAQSDWHSGEQMRQVPNYLWGAVVNYNMQNPTLGAGSCIFIHIWSSPTHGTAGCVAMTQENIEQLLKWLDPSKKPLLVLLPKDEYKNLQKSWQLPNLIS